MHLNVHSILSKKVAAVAEWQRVRFRFYSRTTF